MPRGLDVDEGAHEHTSALKEAKPKPGRIESEHDLRCASELIKDRVELTDLLCLVRNLKVGRDVYLSDDARDDDPITLPSSIVPAIADAIVAKINEIKERLTKEYGIAQ